MSSFKENGSSVVDYALATAALVQHISEFSVEQLKPVISDHCPLTVSIPLAKCTVAPPTDRNALNRGPPTILWDKDSDLQYREVFQSADIQTSLNSLTSDIVAGIKTTPSFTSRLNDIMLNAAKRSIKVITGTRTRKKRVQKRRKRNNISLDERCRSSKSKLQSLKRLIKKYPTDPHIRGQYFKTAKEFRRNVRN